MAASIFCYGVGVIALLLATGWLAERESDDRHQVGVAIEKNKARIDAWLRQPSHENLEVDYVGDGKTPIGRSIHHGSTRSVPCYNSKVILRQDGRGFYVLTSYPEGR